MPLFISSGQSLISMHHRHGPSILNLQRMKLSRLIVSGKSKAIRMKQSNGELFACCFSIIMCVCSIFCFGFYSCIIEQFFCNSSEKFLYLLFGAYSFVLLLIFAMLCFYLTSAMLYLLRLTLIILQ